MNRTLFLIFLFLTLGFAGGSDSAKSRRISQSSSGLRTVTLATPRGDIKVSLPDDIRAGDTISGTVVAEPKGKDEKERGSNFDRLEGYFVEIANRSAKVTSGKTENIKLPDSAQSAQATELAVSILPERYQPALRQHRAHHQ
jgi:hypothetical protein